MSQNRIYFKANKELCEALGCVAEATHEIDLRLGQLGKISVHLCKSCIPKFQDG